MSNYSLGEIDALARKATRGAGYSWGMAEEAGKSVRWLSAYGFSGAEILASYLEQVANKSHELIPSLKSKSTTEDKTSDDVNVNLEVIEFSNEVSENSIAEGIITEGKITPLCALYGGALINDLGHQLENNKIFRFNKMLSPLLALSQAGRVAEAYDICILFSYADTEIICTASGIQLIEIKGKGIQPKEIQLVSNRQKDTPPLLAISLTPVDVVCRRVKHNQDASYFPSPQGRSISADALITLERLAHTTYAPATEESRLKGAG